MRKRALWLGGVGAVVAVAVAVWLASRGGDDPTVGKPAAIAQVGRWMEAGGECEEFAIEASPIPVGPHGPPGTFFQIFGEQPEVGALTGCGGLNGFVGWFRFPDARTMDAALGRHPELTAHEITCTRGSELLIDSLFGYPEKLIPGYCRRLGFEVHRPGAA
jgi:hypothetical protein